MSLNLEQSVYDLLQAMAQGSRDAMPILFCRELSYPRVNRPISTRGWPKPAVDALQGAPTLVAATQADGGSAFCIVHARLAPGGQSSPLSLAAERQVVNQLLRDYPYGLYLFSTADDTHWHLVNVRWERESEAQAAGQRPAMRRTLRRIALGPHERLRTAAERVAMLDLASLGDPDQVSPLAVQQRHDEAFDVEQVTKQFYDDYVAVFRQLEGELQAQTGDRAWAHDYALQFHNRLMFLCYVQRKGWLGDDPEFLTTLWRAYQDTSQPADTFVEQWLQVLFFEAFNNGFQAGRADRVHLPREIRNALQTAPWLNGGLFERNELDRRYPFKVTDQAFERSLNLLNRYNFTVAEDTPLDQEVAVDPEMLGRVYESLVNVSDTVDERGQAGIYYTPRVEIDLMCRLALVDWLCNHLGRDRFALVNELVFSLEPDEQTQADEHVSNANLWPDIHRLLCSVTVCDPACGSGSFLVGALNVLDDLLARAQRQVGELERPYDRKKRIVERSLYGVDVKGWAVQVAELRLWLQLLIDTEIDVNELRVQPVLPNLSFKVRVGDSLVQRIGNVDMAHLGQGRLSAPLKGRITRLKAAKSRYFYNQADAALSSPAKLQHEELNVFRAILDEELARLDARLQELRQGLTPQATLDGMAPAAAAPDKRQLEAQQAELKEHRAQVAGARDSLRQAKDVPFVWDIAFVEVFSGERQGFDLLLGNPPYVRQESIRNPLLARDEGLDEAADKAAVAAYKAALADAAYARWPKTFGYGRGKQTLKLDGRSDLYIYFYLVGLSLLNPQGAFCFVTSNAWLDVGYGAALQRFLLTRGLVRLVLDNQVRRTFKEADVNTVIALLGPAVDDRRDRAASLDHLARFVMFTVSYEQGLSAVLWQEVCEARARRAMPEYRVHPLTQRDALAAGSDQANVYAGDKWGGKYLRAPDIYWEILRRAGDRLVRLGDVADVRRGITTGANEFFFLRPEDAVKWGIEDRFLMPAVKNTRDLTSCWLDDPEKMPLLLFLCGLSRSELAGTGALDYIEFGESVGYHNRSTCKGRHPWWTLRDVRPAHINCNYQIDRVMRFYGSFRPFPVSDNFQEIHYKGSPLAAFAAFNSSFTQLAVNTMGRVNFGGGLLKIQTYEVANLVVPDPRTLRGVETADWTGELLNYGDKARETLDQIIADSLGLESALMRLARDEAAGLAEARAARSTSTG